MLRTWNIIDCGLLAPSTGHHYWEAKALADELLARGAKVRIFSHKFAPEAGFAGAQVYPTFSLGFYASVCQDRSWSLIENFIVHNRVFDRDLSQIERSLFISALNYIPTVSERQLLGLTRWLGKFSSPVSSKVVLTLQPPQGRGSASLYQKVWNDCPDELKNQLVLTVRSTGAADRLQQILGVKPHVLPSLLGPHERRGKIAYMAENEPMTVAFVGGARFERGILHIPEIVRLCMPLGIRFFIQAKSEGPLVGDPRPLTLLQRLPNVTFYEGILDREAYYDAIARSVVLIPYDPDCYRYKSSGVYVDAKFLGAPVIVCAGSPMAEEVKALGNGLVVEEYTAAAIAACIAKAQGEIGRLRERAAAYAKKFSAENGPDLCVDAIASLAGPRT